MRDRFTRRGGLGRSGLPVDEADRVRLQPGAMQSFRGQALHPHRADPQGVGLFGPKVQKAPARDMGVMEYAKIDVNDLIGNDLKVADDFDKKKFVQDAIAAE